MIGIPVGGLHVETNSRYPEELARYVRLEYGDENPEWLILEARNSSKKEAALKGLLAVRPVAEGLPVTH